MRPPGIEPGASAWEAEILPLNHERSCKHKRAILLEFIPSFYWKYELIRPDHRKGFAEAVLPTRNQQQIKSEWKSFF